MAAIIVLGVILVVFARQTRDASALTPSFGDHWHSAYGIYDCTTESFLPNLEDPGISNPGIHTHGDGVMHIHPSGSNATGRNATLEVFLDATRTSINNDAEMTFPNREALVEEGTTCNGEPAVLQVARFAPGATTPIEVITEDLNGFRFEANQESITIALAPIGSDIPAPPEGNLDTAAADSGHILETDGLNDLDLGDLGTGDGTIGVDEDGNIVDADGNILVPADAVGTSTEDPVDAGDTPEANRVTTPFEVMSWRSAAHSASPRARAQH